jgi:TolA-binding protein
MRTSIIIFSLILICGGPLAAKKPASNEKTIQLEEKKDTQKERSSFLSSWLSKLKNRISQSRSHHSRVVAVASVRGAKTDNAPPLYWKGGTDKDPVELSELDEFDAAIELAIQGQTEEALSALNKFIENNPESPLVADAQKTALLLKPEESKTSE